MILDDFLVEKFKNQYGHVHPLVFQRSIERAKNSADLFEILETIPKPPFSWNEEKHRWIKDMDVSSKKKLKKMISKKK